MNISELVKTIVPDMPEDRRVLTTADWGNYFAIDYNKRVLYVPNEKAFRMNHILIDQIVDAVKAFAKSDLVAPSWDMVKYVSDEGKAELAEKLIRSLPREGYISCDIESRNTSFRDNKVLSIGFCTEADPYTGIMITAVAEPQVHEALNELFACPDIHWIWHNGKFDIGRLKFLENLDARVDEDTMLMHFVGVNERRGTHGLKDLGAILIQAPDWDAELDQIKKTQCKRMGITLAEFDYGLFPTSTLLKYAAFDVVATLKLFFVLRKMMRPGSINIYRMLIRASNVYSRVELNGVYLDNNHLEDMEYELDKRAIAAEKHFHEAVQEYWDPITYKQESGSKSMPKAFNMKSPAQLKWLLSRVIGRSLPNTTKEEMADLFAEFGDVYPIIGALSEIRKCSKYLDTYINGLRKVVCADNRIRCTYNLHGTETGRLSASDPNMQNIPRDKSIKNLFMAPEGKVFVQFDYSQAELRVLAYLSQDENLKSIYREDKDLHGTVAMQMFGPNYTKEQRVQAKTINFGIAYGRGAANIAQVFKMPVYEAQKLINNWFKQMPQVEKWIQNQRSNVGKSDPPCTCMGRERHFIITSDNYNHVQNECVNFPIQSIASDMTLCSLVSIDQWLHDEHLDDRAKIIITVHDSIILEADDDRELVEKLIKGGCGIMSSTPSKYLEGLDFPFKADADVGKRWGDMHEIDEYYPDGEDAD